MKLKLDENLGERGRLAWVAAGHQVCTVPMQALQSANDQELLARCVAESRALVTLDLDFSNPLVFPPDKHAGVAVLRLPRKATSHDLDQAIGHLGRGVTQPIAQPTALDRGNRPGPRVFTVERPAARKLYGNVIPFPTDGRTAVKVEVTLGA